MSLLLQRLNLVSIVAAAIALASLFLPWWGFNLPQGLGRSTGWYLWNPPRFNPRIAGASAVYWNFTISSVSVLILALITTAFVVVGSLTLLRRYLVAGLLLSLLTPIAYALAINYVTTDYCVTPLCLQGPVGTVTVPVFGTNGVVISWGFQSGFYLFLAAALLMVGGLAYNRTLTKTPSTVNPIITRPSATPAAASCSQCGTPIIHTAKFCPNCGHAKI